MRRIPILVVATAFVLVVPSTSWASHSLAVTTGPTAFLLSTTKVHVSGTLTCVGAASSGSVGVVLIQPPGSVTLNGEARPHSRVPAGSRCPGVVVIANGFSSFAQGPARFDTFANTPCSDEDVDCPSVGIDGMLQIERAPICFGERATILGHDGDERIEGAPGADVIVGRGGRDIVFGGGGDDLICGNGGSDVLDGGDGDDHMFGASGPDFITGVDGNDEILGGVGDDVLNFGDEEDGDDVVSGGSGHDDLHAGVALDRLFGNHGRDTLQEGEVDAPMIDLFAGGAGIDTCSAGAEDEVRGCETP